MNWVFIICWDCIFRKCPKDAKLGFHVVEESKAGKSDTCLWSCPRLMLSSLCSPVFPATKPPFLIEGTSVPSGLTHFLCGCMPHWKQGSYSALSHRISICVTKGKCPDDFTPLQKRLILSWFYFPSQIEPKHSKIVDELKANHTWNDWTWNCHATAQTLSSQSGYSYQDITS